MTRLAGWRKGEHYLWGGVNQDRAPIRRIDHASTAANNRASPLCRGNTDESRPRVTRLSSSPPSSSEGVSPVARSRFFLSSFFFLFSFFASLWKVEWMRSSTEDQAPLPLLPETEFAFFFSFVMDSSRIRMKIYLRLLGRDL